MFGDQTISARSKLTPDKEVSARPLPLARRKQLCIELDMGEASREEGFRLNGSR